MSDSLLTLESLLIGDIDNISGSNISHEKLFSSERFLSLLFLDNSFNVLFRWHGFVHGWYDEREHEIRIIPLRLSWFSGFMIEFISWDPILIKCSFIECRSTWLISNNNIVTEL